MLVYNKPWTFSKIKQAKYTVLAGLAANSVSLAAILISVLFDCQEGNL